VHATKRLLVAGYRKSNNEEGFDWSNAAVGVCFILLEHTTHGRRNYGKAPDTAIAGSGND
jgi:hypothetical protein